MREEALSYLGCCKCKSHLKIDQKRSWKGEMRSGKLICKGCGLSFQVVTGRPVMMTSESIREWRSPVSEAMGVSSYETFEESIKKLSSIGVNEALASQTERGVNPSETGKSIPDISPSVISKMRYRASGEWLKHNTRMERLMTFPWKEGDPENSFNVFMRAIAETNPESLLDVASGGGFGVSHQAWFNPDIKQILAVERDLKCLGNIQSRFKYIGRSESSEAVGGDVRSLPVRTETINTAMMLAALPEIYGISSVISEIHRTLKDGGHWIILVSELPFASHSISSMDFIRFAEGAGLYSGYEKFQSDAEKFGFIIENSERFEEKTGKFKRMISLRK